MKTTLVEIRAKGSTEAFTREVKDPSVVQLKDGTYMMYATSPDPTVKGSWMSRFSAAQPQGPWQEIGGVNVQGIEGGEICAPSVILEEKDGKPVYRMYVQTSCFSEDGAIAVAVSEDGENFHPGDPPFVMTSGNIAHSPHKVISIYDVAVSEMSLNGIAHECMVFSGYRHIGCGDVYMSLRKKGAPDDSWSTPKLVLEQENVAFHNKPGSKNFEWGLEGAKIIQLREDIFLMVGVCFLDKDVSARGTRQRVFMAAARTIDGTYHAFDTPIAPTSYPQGTGENGHPDIFETPDGRIAILYQERSGDGKEHPWHLRYTDIDKKNLIEKALKNLCAGTKPHSIANKKPKI